MKLEEKRSQEADDTRYSAGAEEHVVTTGVGSSQYGGSVRARDNTKKKKKKKNFGENFLGIRPEPGDGSMDYSATHDEALDFKGFRFYVMAGTSDTISIDDGLESQLAELRNFTKYHPDRVPFAIHLGGTETQAHCNETIYENRAKILALGPSPTVVTPGTSDSYDCPNPEEAMEFFERHLGEDLALRWDTNQTDLLDIRRSDRHPELFRFLYDGILVIGLHVIDPVEEYVSARQKRMVTSLEWLAESVETMFEQHEIRGVIIAGHSGKSERNERFFSKAKKYFIARSNVPVLYLYGDKLDFDIDKNSSPFYFVQISPSPLLGPTFIDVAPRINGEPKHLHLQKDREQTIIGYSMFRIDQQGRAYPNAGETP